MKKVLIFQFVPGAGGKFIINTLAYSGQVAISDSRIAHNFLKNQNYEYLNKVLTETVPPKNEGKGEWFQRELGCWQLWGAEIQSVRDGKTIDQKILKSNEELVNNNLWLPVIAHCSNSYNNLINYFCNDQIFTVYVKPTAEFLDCAIRKKWSGKDDCLDLNVLTVIERDLSKARHDFIVENWDPRLGLNQITELAEQLKINLDLSLAKQYTDRYIDFHLN